MSQVATREPVLLADYRPPAWLTDTIDLTFRLDPQATEVTSIQHFRRNPAVPREDQIVLWGEDQDLLSLHIDGASLPESAYRVQPDHIVIFSPPDSFTLEVRSRINPRDNGTLMGLYLSSGIYCTQCEPEGFRRITYFQDRPDVMARYRVRIEADKASCPVLLSNGNPGSIGDLPDGRHFAEWSDPFPKPSYLFALVAGDLACLEDVFVTRSGRRVTLRIYASAHDIGQCRHAMDSLIKSMKWDEEVYGLEYDLDLFMIVAVGDFNFGAMENKGLNIFNTSAALAKRETSTDADFMSVERIIAHEYFHNWTGNRITCRDWFQLTLKEGLTVLRDQQFSADMHSAPVQRIGDAVMLREMQFAEDAGPLAHPIRPDNYIEINNFYTGTVYQKGAEVIRMLGTLIGPEDYRKGIDLYISRHDGQAVTCEDFVACMAEASGRDLSQFMRWYHQAGTPQISVTSSYDAGMQTFTLEVSQETPATPGQPAKEPFHIPLRLGLVGADGGQVPLQLAGENEPKGTDRVLELHGPSQRFTFVNVPERPVPSLLRHFSAPVKFDADLSDADLGHLLAHDTDGFARWDAGQSLALRVLLRRAGGGASAPAKDLIGAFAAVLDRAAEDPAFAARAVALPGSSYIGQQMPRIDVEGITSAVRATRRELGSALRDRWLTAYRSWPDAGPFSVSTEAIARRALKNAALAYLTWAGDPEGQDLARTQLAAADNMTDGLAALRQIVETAMPERDDALAAFHDRWRDEALVLNKWFALQAAIEDEEAPERVAALMSHPSYIATNPNRVRAVLGTFAAQNLTGFHRKDGAGYRLLVDRCLQIDPRNPQLAARLLGPMGRWRRFDDGRQALMRAELERAAATPGLSRNSYEIVTKSLA